MGGMFYSLKEAAEKLDKTEEQVKQLAKDGKLREFRDGSTLLFKIDEVEALKSDTSLAAPQETSEQLEEPIEQEQPVEIEQAPKAEPVPEPELAVEPESMPEMEAAEEAEPTLEPEAAAEPIPKMEPAAELEEIELPEPEPSLQPEAVAEQEGQMEEISLAPETATPTADTDLTNLDTAITGQGINVLGETDHDYKVTDDSMAETVSPTGTVSEASLEEIEEDVNLDSFGSGSGLLDLSLQADDTSLGGILDEIYTTEGGEEAQAPAEAGSEAEVAAEADQLMPEDEFVGTQPIAEAPALMQAYVEPAPDVQSNTLGMLLFLPLLLLLYTAIVTVAAQRGVIPSIMALIQGIIWYIVIGAVVVTGLVTGATFMLGTDATKKSKKPKKPRKSKTKKGSEKTPEEEVIS